MAMEMRELSLHQNTDESNKPCSLKETRHKRSHTI